MGSLDTQSDSNTLKRTVSVMNGSAAEEESATSRRASPQPPSRPRKRLRSFRPPVVRTSVLSTSWEEPAGDAISQVQTGILPTGMGLRELEFMSYVRPVDSSFAGDFFDICCHNKEETWLFLGDVTGHGPRAGLVKLIAQRILTALVKSRPGISPAELNYLANRSLCSHLDRFGEERYLSIVSICQRRDGRFVVSGSHDSMFVVRAEIDTVEEVQLTHFPFGLGFLGNLEKADFTECEVKLGPHDILYIGTDGVTEAARDGDHAKGIFGDDALKRFLASIGQASLDEARADLVAVLDEYTGGCYRDDVAFLMIRPMLAS